ncbi:MAG: TfuA-like protein [Roseiarcus sp.]
MKVLFIGPTLHDLVDNGRLSFAPGIRCLPPASQGDIARAVRCGATVIGLVDGRYEDVAAPWHKEILYAIEQGVTVLGGASLGALRAAECAPFGMIGIGGIFERYRSGELVDDSDVAQCHAPDELGNVPMSEAFVNVEATIRKAEMVGDVEAEEAGSLLAIARGMFFKELCFERLAAARHGEERAAKDLLERLLRNRVDVKRRDALELVAALSALPDAIQRKARAWRLAKPAIWRRFIERLPDEPAAANFLAPSHEMKGAQHVGGEATRA